MLPTELFKMQGLMRMRLSPDCSKLVMCTTGGYLVLVHNLSLQHLAQDLQDFKVGSLQKSQCFLMSLRESNYFLRSFSRLPSLFKYCLQYFSEMKAIMCLII